MPGPQTNFQLEFYDLLKNDPTIFKWISEHIVNGIWYVPLDASENLWISDSFWKTLGYLQEEKTTLHQFKEVLSHPEVINALSRAKNHSKQIYYRKLDL